MPSPEVAETPERRREVGPEERVRRVKAALAEAGYPDATILPVASEHRNDVRAVGGRIIPRPVLWRAGVTAGLALMPCWPCYDAASGRLDDKPADFCTHDPLTSEWPPRLSSPWPPLDREETP